MATKKITLNELRSIVKQIIKEENNSFLSYIGKKMKYGSPGYAMTFIPREINKISDEVVEFVGELPSIDGGSGGHFFEVSTKSLRELKIKGETYWTAKDGGHSYLAI